MEHNYSLKTQDGFTFVTKDGNPTLCPYQNKLAIPQQSAMGQMSMGVSQYPCSITCPHCNLTEESGNEFIEISCSPILKKFPLTEISEEPTKESKLIKL